MNLFIDFYLILFYLLTSETNIFNKLIIILWILTILFFGENAKNKIILS